jgi:predicted ribonuclease toxin of YeeF-YezG toxin-antitoxin module
MSTETEKLLPRLVDRLLDVIDHEQVAGCQETGDDHGSAPRSVTVELVLCDSDRLTADKMVEATRMAAKTVNEMDGVVGSNVSVSTAPASDDGKAVLSVTAAEDDNKNDFRVN